MCNGCFDLTAWILGEKVALIGSPHGVIPTTSYQVVQIRTLTILILGSFPVVTAAAGDHLGLTHRIGWYLLFGGATAVMITDVSYLVVLLLLVHAHLR